MRRTLSRPIALGALVAAGAMIASAGPASAETEVDAPDTFTSAFTVMATPDAVIDPDGNPVDGAPGATGTFDFMVNSELDIICYDITTTGVEPPYESMAKTATHIHEASAGQAGPPRIAFPNPEGSGDTRTSSGCLKGPFTTGIEDDAGNDTGEGFTLSQLEADPAAFAADTHTSQFVAGAVRGQLRSMPVGGVDTGQGGLAPDAGGSADDSMLLMGLGLGGVLVAAGGLAARRRARA
ncbi:CHRD domain-containing protein [Nocardioides sp. C4-1]|uniref:CHRD domain-containing protein n=1 Tax=Nocardioides sp. C4-1 TaxID=3151851 RepID=UPI00326624C7